MATAGLLDTVNLYTMREADLTNQLGDIVTQINRETTKSMKLLDTTGKKKAAVREQYEAGSEQYKDAMGEIQDEYELSLAQINQWESELEVKKEDIQTELKATTASKEGFQAALKQNVTKDYQYGGNGGS